MSIAVVIDTGPLGLLTNPKPSPHAVACRAWLNDVKAAGRRILIPEIADYELRREYIRGKRQRSLAFLDRMCANYEYLPITTLAMRLAADLWASSRNTGVPTASSGSLDGDVILAAQASALNIAFIVATGNPAHLSRFVPSELWSNIVP